MFSGPEKVAIILSSLDENKRNRIISLLDQNELVKANQAMASISNQNYQEEEIEQVIAEFNQAVENLKNIKMGGV